MLVDELFDDSNIALRGTRHDGEKLMRAELEIDHSSTLQTTLLTEKHLHR